MANITVPSQRGVILPREAVIEKIGEILVRHPDLISFDVADERNERTYFAMKVDPGCGAAERNGWEGEVAEWYFGSYTITDEQTGELQTLPSLALMATDGRLIRFTNSEPAVRSWLAILREIGVERVKKGVRVRVHLRASQTAGRHYWQILPA